ncbi:MAG: lipase maturation factor family protein, partial [Halobacteria archaeon]|nr:lipase maturation factor family protein [Halobacteria archaeon]
MWLWGAESYWLVRFLFQRGLALIYLIAFLVAANQFRPLAGENGLLPIDEYVERAAFKERPSLFYLVPNDRVIGIVAWTGVGLALIALLAVPYWLPNQYSVPASIILWGAMWAMYLSFVNAGRIFYGYGWESMLLETGFLAIFLGAGASGPPVVVIWLLKWVLFRNMFGAGLIKIRGDDCWRELTCLDYHYETQPMPNPVSWYAHNLPDSFHRFEVLGNHVVELAVPFLYFAPQPYAAVGGVATILFQAWLMLTGNFSWLNALTIVQAIATFSDGVLMAILPFDTPSIASTPLYLEVMALLVGVLIVVLSVRPVRNMLSPTQVMNTSFDPLHLVNTYGAFGSIT